MLRQFPGYTLRTLLEEDITLLRYLTIETLGREEVEFSGE